MKNKSKCKDCGWMGYPDATKCPVCEGKLSDLETEGLSKKDIRESDVLEEDRFDREKLSEKYNRDALETEEGKNVEKKSGRVVRRAYSGMKQKKISKRILIYIVMVIVYITIKVFRFF